MKAVLPIVFIVVSFNSIAQNGYLKLVDDGSVLVGYLKYYTNHLNGQAGIELWKTKTDRDPLQFPKTEIFEYAIKKDTIPIIQNFRPFENTPTYFDLVEAKIISRGKVNLFWFRLPPDIYLLQNFCHSHLIIFVLRQVK
jgi:hypothetical protein